MNPDADLLFVYGTLRAALAHDMHQLLSRHADPVSGATARGALYDLGQYPGLVATPGGDSIVRGEVYRLRSETAARTLRTLDEYEGCAPTDPKPHEYRREKIQVTLADRSTSGAWAYVLQRDTAGLPRIESGDSVARDVKSVAARFVAERPRTKKDQ